MIESVSSYEKRISEAVNLFNEGSYEKSVNLYKSIINKASKYNGRIVPDLILQYNNGINKK
jgi:hypothetical protein